MEKTSTREAAGFATLLVTSPQQTGQQILRNPENRLRLESQRIVNSIGRPLKCVFEVVVYRIALPPPLSSTIIQINYSIYYPLLEVGAAPAVRSELGAECLNFRERAAYFAETGSGRSTIPRRQTPPVGRREAAMNAPPLPLSRTTGVSNGRSGFGLALNSKCISQLQCPTSLL